MVLYKRFLNTIYLAPGFKQKILFSMKLWFFVLFIWVSWMAFLSYKIVEKNNDYGNVFMVDFHVNLLNVKVAII